MTFSLFNNLFKSLQNVNDDETINDIYMYISKTNCYKQQMKRNVVRQSKIRTDKGVLKGTGLAIGPRNLDDDQQ
jgi:hypothetical protein